MIEKVVTAWIVFEMVLIAALAVLLIIILIKLIKDWE